MPDFTTVSHNVLLWMGVGANGFLLGMIVYLFKRIEDMKEKIKDAKELKEDIKQLDGKLEVISGRIDNVYKLLVETVNK